MRVEVDGDRVVCEGLVVARGVATLGDRSVRIDELPDDGRRFADVLRERRDVGTALGTTSWGVKHVRVDPGKLSAVPHTHSHEHEAFVLLAGSATEETWEGDARPVAPFTVVDHPPGTGISRCFRAGPDGCDLLAFGERDPSDTCFYPRSKKVALRGLGVVFRIEPLDYWDGEPS